MDYQKLLCAYSTWATQNDCYNKINGIIKFNLTNIYNEIHILYIFYRFLKDSEIWICPTKYHNY